MCSSTWSRGNAEPAEQPGQQQLSLSRSTRFRHSWIRGGALGAVGHAGIHVQNRSRQRRKRRPERLYRTLKAVARARKPRRISPPISADRTDINLAGRTCEGRLQALDHTASAHLQTQAAPRLPHATDSPGSELDEMPSGKAVGAIVEVGSTPLSHTCWLCAPDAGKRHLTSGFGPMWLFRCAQEVPSGLFVPHAAPRMPARMVRNGIPEGVSARGRCAAGRSTSATVMGQRASDAIRVRTWRSMSSRTRRTVSRSCSWGSSTSQFS